VTNISVIGARLSVGFNCSRYGTYGQNYCTALSNVFWHERTGECFGAHAGKNACLIATDSGDFPRKSLTGFVRHLPGPDGVDGARGRRQLEQAGTTRGSLTRGSLSYGLMLAAIGCTEAPVEEFGTGTA
jgi:hypothetical protein